MSYIIFQYRSIRRNTFVFVSFVSYGQTGNDIFIGKIMSQQIRNTSIISWNHIITAYILSGKYNDGWENHKENMTLNIIVNMKKTHGFILYIWNTKGGGTATKTFC